MKIRHRVPSAECRPAVVSDEYEAEVARATQSAERRYRQAQQRLAAAERRLEKVRSTTRPVPGDIAVATALVELRRQELDELARMMQSAPATAVHRGTRSFGPVPRTFGSRL